MTDGALRKRILFLCTGNSARSQIAEALMRQLAGPAFEVLSAGTLPRKTVHPSALQTLARYQVPADGLRPKDVAAFVGQPFDYVVTVCDRAVEQCPVFPGADMIHWTFPDPAEAGEAMLERAFDEVFLGLKQRIRLLLSVSGARRARS